MKLTVNGKSLEFAGGNIPALVDQLDAISEHVAVMVNGAIVPRENWGTSVLSDGDDVEVLTFAAGG